MEKELIDKLKEVQIGTSIELTEEESLLLNIVNGMDEVECLEEEE